MRAEILYIATAQIPISGDMSQNRTYIEDQIREAKNQGADIVHFPEGSLAGYSKHDISSDWSLFDWGEFDRQLDALKQLCARLGIWAVFGGLYRAAPSKRPFNSLYVINARGDIAARYDKRFCSHSEITDWYSAGDRPVLIELKGQKIGFALCIEIQFPEVFMEYERLGADLVLFSAYSDSVMFGIQAQAHAACNTYWISVSVPSNTGYNLRSHMIGPDGQIIDSCKKVQGDIVVSDINPDDPHWDVPCKKARPWRALARKGDIYTG